MDTDGTDTRRREFFQGPPALWCVRAPSRRWVRPAVWAVLTAAVAAVAFVSVADRHVRLLETPRIYREASRVPEAPVAMVFGALVFPSGELSPVLRERVEAGIALYRAGKVRKLLMTGDNGRQAYDEVSAMKAYAVRHGVPARDIVRDYAGFRTYDSCYRARNVFGVERAVLVTQAFHLPRALYLARRLGIDAVGFAADRGAGAWHGPSMRHRERLACAAAVLDLLFHRKPRFLGRPEPVFADERNSR